MKLNKTFHAAYALAFFLFVASTPSAEDDISLLVPSFQSDQGALGRAVSTYLGLQIWATLVWARGEQSFGHGNVFWGPALTSPPSFNTAEFRAKSRAVLAQLVLWGEAFEYGDGVIAESHLSLPQYKDFREHNNEIWSVNIGDTTLKADLPRRRYSFEPVILRPTVVERYGSVVELPIFEDQTFEKRKGVLGIRFRAEKVLLHAAKVRSGNDVGWLPLMQLAERPSEVVDFVAGIIRIYRGDWMGARELFQRVLEKQFAPTEIRVDSALLRARAAAELGIDPRPDIEKAELSGAVTRTVFQYAIISDIQFALKSGHDKSLSRARSRLEEAKMYFAKDDPWLMSAQKAIEILHNRPNPRSDG